LEASTKNIHSELIERCRNNDQKAQFEIYKLYYKPMYNASLRILNNSAEAEDIMQESFLDAFRKINDYTGKGNFGGWLRRIVVNNSLDELKKKKDLIPIDEKHLEYTQQTEAPTDFVECKLEEVKTALKELADEDRVIISLFLFEGYDHEEISQILDISNNASRTRYSRAKKRLVDMINKGSKMKMQFNPN
jgi:RNA polymerase sigma-70 factor (ECF subfamily)